MRRELLLMTEQTPHSLNRAAHRIRVIVNSSSFPRFDINPGTGKSWLTTKEKVKVDNRVYASARYPSHIVLPVMP